MYGLVGYQDWSWIDAERIAERFPTSIGEFAFPGDATIFARCGSYTVPLKKDKRPNGT
jgi:hypothetical protein